MSRPYVWEKSYPPGISWDTPIETLTLPAMLDRSVARNAERYAISFRERRMTYRELADAADAFAAGLLKAGIGKGDAIGCYLPNSPHHVIAMFGATRAGARLVQLSPLDAERELIHKLKDSGARIVLTANVPPLLPMALKLKAAGFIDTLIVADDGEWGAPPYPLLPIPDGDGIVPLAQLTDAALPAQWPAIAPERRRGAAIYRRHHRHSQRRDADACEPERVLRDL